MVADGYIWTLRPTFAPKQRSRNRLQPKKGLGLNRKSGCASIHSTRRVISPGVYFFARRFSLTSSISIGQVRGQTTLAIATNFGTHKRAVLLNEAKHFLLISVRTVIENGSEILRFA